MTQVETTLIENNGQAELRVQLCGRLDADGVAALRPALEASARADAERIVLDLTDVAVMDGSGIGAIAHMFKRATASGRGFALRGANGQPLSLLHDLGLAATFGLTPPARRVRRPFFAGFAAPAGA